MYFFYSKAIVGSGLLGFGLTLVARKANLLVIRMCLIGAGVLLIGPLVELLTVILDMAELATILIDFKSSNDERPERPKTTTARSTGEISAA